MNWTLITVEGEHIPLNTVSADCLDRMEHIYSALEQAIVLWLLADSVVML